MSLLSLNSPFELTNTTFGLITSLQCGVPLPAKWLPPLSSGSIAQDDHGYSAINVGKGNFRTASHDHSVHRLGDNIRRQSLILTTQARSIPRPTSANRPDSHGDMLITSALGLPGTSLTDRAETVLDLSLVHSISKSQAQDSFSFNDKSIPTKEQAKISRYSRSYNADNIAFAPVVGDTFGRIGLQALRFFKKVAHYVFAKSATAGSLALEEEQGCHTYNRLRLFFLQEIFEATRARILRGRGGEPASSPMDVV